MPAPTCVRCDQAFPANHQLSTLPEGRRVAMDTERGRVWRICHGCGEWNLLSQESASQVLPELDRLAAGLPTEVVDHGVSRSRTNLLELLRVGVSAGMPRDPGVEERHAKVVRRQRGLALFGIVSLAAAITMPWWFEPGPRYIAALCGTLWSAMLIARIPRVRRLKHGSGRTELVLGSMLFGMAMVAAVDGQELRVLLGMWLMLVPLHMWIDRGLPFGWTRLPSGGKVWIRRRELDETRVRVDAEGSIRLTLPNGRVLDALDSAAVLRDLLDGYSWETTAEAQKVGATLLPDSAPLEGILSILRPALEADPDGLPLVQLPPTWRAALDLALAATSGTPGRLSALAAKAREAQHVAEIAESLDREP